MKRPGDLPFKRLPASQNSVRPGKVVALKGIIFQSDASSVIGALFIRPLEAFDRWQAGLVRAAAEAPLAMHAGLHVVLEDGRNFVAEQLVGTAFEDFKDGLNWTPLEAFRIREGKGWDATVPATAFRGIDDEIVAQVVDYLNVIEGHAFLGEDCTQFIERAFNKRRLFGDSPTGQALGLGLRVGDPALPLLRPDATLDARSSKLLRVSVVQAQPDPTSAHDAPNAHLWLGRAIVWCVIAGITAGLLGLLRHEKRARQRWF